MTTELYFRTAKDLAGLETDNLNNLPVEVIDIKFNSWYVKFPNGERLHAFADELFIREVK